MRKITIIVGIIIIVFVILTGIYFSFFNNTGLFGKQTWSYDEMEDFTDEISSIFTDVNRLDISSVIADVNIIEGKKGKVTAKLYGELPKDYRNVPKLIIRNRGRKVKIKVRYMNKNVNLKSGLLTLDIHVPADYANILSVTCDSGSIKIKQRKNSKLFAGTVSGDLSLAELNCTDLICESISGDIILNNIICMDNLDSRSTSGKITFKDIEAKAVKSASVSGNILFKGLTEKINMETVSGLMDVTVNFLKDDTTLTGVSGDIRLSVNPTASFDLSAESTSGEIQVPEFDVDVKKLERNLLQGKVNGGGVDVNIRTTSGDITIKKIKD